MATATEAFLFALPHYEDAFKAWEELRGTVYEVDALLNMVAWTHEVTHWGALASQEHGKAPGEAWSIIIGQPEPPPMAWDVI